MKDIETREDVVRLVDTFYAQILESEIAFIFTDVAKLDFKAHMPIMYDFWSTMLLSDRSYSGNPMIKHIALHQKTPLGEKEFNVWLTLFCETVERLFEGPKADEAMMRARSIAGLMQHKVAQFSSHDAPTTPKM